MRYGYRRVHVLLQRDGWAVNVKRIYRLYGDLSLPLRNKTPKRRVKAKLRKDRTDARQINETWAMDFVHDQLATGRKIRVLRSSTPSVASLRPSIRASVSRGGCRADPGAYLQNRRLSQDNPR
ncbi:IS3 family transposase [Tardiphaga sp. 619_E2_N8_5]|uniref:IS3 family transposase n=1 Tax=unclassified Tardiphaga TaxID=2631404 RepID=UPI003F1F6330